MQVLWSVLLTRLFSGLAMDFPSFLNTLKTDDRCVNVWSVPVGVLMVVMCTRDLPPPHLDVLSTHPMHH